MPRAVKSGQQISFGLIINGSGHFEIGLCRVNISIRVSSVNLGLLRLVINCFRSANLDSVQSRFRLELVWVYNSFL